MSTNHQPTDISIIIVSYNTRDITQQCIASIYQSLEGANNPFTVEIIVWDNNSHDGSVEMLQELAHHHANLVIISHHENIGFGKANNRAVEHAQGTYVLLLNSDTIIVDNAIKRLLLYYQEHEDTISFLGPKLLNKDLTDQPSAAPFYSLLIVFAALYLRGDHWGITRSSPHTVQKVGWISGACILTKKSIYTMLKGFDEEIFMYFEEVDLLYRAHKKGYTTWVYPQARIVHLGSASSNGRTEPIIQVYRGFLYFYHKHHAQMHIAILKIMLQYKALVLWGIGTLIRNTYLRKTYAEAYKLVTMDR